MTTIEQLYENNVHIGHKREKWNPRMKQYIAGTEKGVDILNLDATLHELGRAQDILKKLKTTNGKVLIVGTKPQTSFVIKSELTDSKLFYVDEKWSPGLLTNFPVIRERIEYYRSLKSQFETGEIKKYTKKEQAKFKKDLDKLHATYHGVGDMRGKPDALIVLDSVGNELAMKEAIIAKIPVIALCDTDGNPENIDVVIPANDDSIASIRFVLQSLVSALS